MRMYFKAGRVFVILAGLFFVFAGSAPADEIYLKNGRMMQGEIIEESDGEVILRMKLGKTVVPRKDIVSMEKKDLPEDYFGLPDEKPERSSATPGEKTQDNKVPYDFKITASYEPQADNVRVTVSGEATLPNGATIEIFIKRRERFITSGRTSVFGNRISMDFRFSKRRFFPAVYTVSAIFIPERQSPDVRKILQSNFAFGPRVKTVEASCPLYAGRIREIIEAEVEAKCEVGTAMAKLEMMQSELSAKFTAAKKNFKAREWDKWSYTWMLYMRGIQKKQDPRNSFFPEADEAVVIAANTLLKLWQYCNLELRDPAAYNKIKNDPKTRIRPEELKKLLDKGSFNELLDNIRKEASMPEMYK